jgi:hypothetical protein
MQPTPVDDISLNGVYPSLPNQSKESLGNAPKQDPDTKLEANNSLLASSSKLIDYAPTDPENPKNWSLRRRWLLTVLVSCYTFISLV